MDQDLRVGQRHALALRAPGQQQRAHRHRDADADRLHVRLDELHRVVDRQARVDRAARRVDVERDVLLGVLGLEVQQLRDDQVGDLVVDGRAEEDDPLVEQAAVDVERTLAARGLLDDHRYQWAHFPRFPMSSPLFRLADQIPLEASDLVSTTVQAPLRARSPHPAQPPLPCPASTSARAPAPGRARSASRASAISADRLARREILAHLFDASRAAQVFEQLLRRRGPRARRSERAPRAGPPREDRCSRPRPPR